jgi:hypothetical protein
MSGRKGGRAVALFKLKYEMENNMQPRRGGVENGEIEIIYAIIFIPRASEIP